MTIATINLFGEEGIEIGLDRYGDIVVPDHHAKYRVVGRAFYACSIEQAHELIRAEFDRRLADDELGAVFTAKNL